MPLEAIACVLFEVLHQRGVLPDQIDGGLDEVPKFQTRVRARLNAPQPIEDVLRYQD